MLPVKIYFLAVLGLALTLFVGGGVALAHTTGASWEEPVGDYRVDVGYDPVNFVAGSYIRFDFSLEDASGDAQKDFAEVWVRIVDTQTKDTLLATGLRHQPTGPTTLLYTPQKPGTYSLEVSFRKETGDEIAAKSFPLDVTGGVETPLVPYFVVSLVGLGVGAFGVSLFSNWRKARKS